MFKANTAIQQRWKNADYETKLLQLLEDLRPYKVDDNVKQEANKLWNKEYKSNDMIPKGQEYDFSPYMDGLAEIETDDLALQHAYGKEWRQIVDDFVQHAPAVSNITMDAILSLNSEGFKKVKEQRAAAILKWCKDNAAEASSKK